MSEVPLIRRKPVKTVEEIKASPAFAALRSASQRDFVVMLAGGATPMAAIGAVYNFTAKENARQFMYKLFKKTPMKNVLRELYGEGNKTDFLKDLSRAANNKKVTIGQVQALVVYGVARGFIPSNFTLGNHSELVDD